LNSYVKSQNHNVKGLGHKPSSARTSKRPFTGKVLLGEKGRQTVQGFNNTEGPFQEYIQSVSLSNKMEIQSVGAQNLRDVLHDKQSYKNQIQAEKVRNSKDFKIRKTSGIRAKDTDINKFIKKNKYVKVLKLRLILI
jgi:hypothetical protein